MKRKKSKKYTKLDSLLEMPREVVSTDVKMTILGYYPDCEIHLIDKNNYRKL